MAEPDDKRRKTPADRFRTIISADQNRENTPAKRTYPRATSSPTLKLPKPIPGNGSQPAAPAVGPAASRISAPTGVSRILQAFWTIASVISLLVNIVLLIFVFGLLQMAGSLNAAALGPGLLGGLYANFERMDQAHIKTMIPVQTIVPLNLTVPVQTTTGITLAKAASIPGAHVRINTALFNIDAPANVTLPAGTALDVTMAFTLPVQAQVPVTLNVPVDIPLRDTDLHVAILGLQDTLKPLYCLVTPAAQSLSGQPVCK
ncbi:MAG TPA: hypothetical protein VF784_00275 [Anaerolineales bacterium]